MHIDVLVDDRKASLVTQLQQLCHDGDQAAIVECATECCQLHRLGHKHLGAALLDKQTVQELLFVTIRRAFDAPLQPLIQLGASVNEKEPRGAHDMPLHLACKLHLEHVVDRLIEHQADVNVIHDKSTPISLSLSFDLAHTYDAHSPDGSALYACDNRIVHRMLHSGQPIKLLNSLLRLAAKGLRADAVKSMLALQAAPLDPSQDKRTALHLCLTSAGMLAHEPERLEIVKLLAAHGNINEACANRELEGKRPLSMACANATVDVAVVRTLLSSAADPNLADRNGLTPLYWAVNTAHVLKVQLLLEHAANPNTPEPRTLSTPLHHAIKHDLPDIFLLLLAHGANLNARQADQKTPLDCVSITSSMGSQCT
jgi:ankyrin repeat protein